ncbi:MAG: folylpolyglutamate synthase/dihydrofolate synthase family protein [Candidatus Peregrinibacteria bacterium]|nr:folylpolyglutamate synthase/dihydrofolate synthase family protein [Candidatus Peregrinibacteria bacterium]MDZ4245208.1 folylpolyglutamate synthase/dihydrofolate synthase family protein [Candidatus Gracilibacteria bacterium]
MIFIKVIYEKFEKLRLVMGVLGNPEKNIRFVHVTGSKGKGSVCAMTASILKEAGWKVGLFTSPHIQKWNERVRVNGVDISDEDLKIFENRVDTICSEIQIELTEMERFFMIALGYFGEQKVEIAVVEVGIGGRKDATNVIDGIVSIITNIELEHTEILGETLEKIALDKAGIIKEGSVCITAETDSRLIEVFAKEAGEKKAKLIVLEPSDTDLISQTIKGQVFNFMNYNNVEIPLLGRHQTSNATIAIMCCEALNTKGVKIDENNIRNGLKNVSWPLRLEVINLKDKNMPTIIIDGAHTPKSIQRVVQSLNKLCNQKKKIVIAGFSEDKKYAKILEILLKDLISPKDELILTQAKYKGLDVDTIAECLNGAHAHITYSVATAHAKAQKLAQKTDVIICLGSLYLGAEYYKILTKSSYINL